MTDINTLTQNVIDREQAKLKESIAEFEEQIKAETEEEKQKLKQEFVARKSQVEKEFERQLDISINSIDLRKRDKELSVKRELINQYITDVEASLANLDRDTTIKFITNILSQYQASEQAELVFGEKTKALLTDALQDVTHGFKVSDETIPNESGFILQGSSLQYNYLFSNLVENIKQKLEAIIVRNVFNK